jgi:hypothetical protein
MTLFCSKEWWEHEHKEADDRHGDYPMPALWAEASGAKGGAGRPANVDMLLSASRLLGFVRSLDDGTFGSLFGD